MTHTSLHKEIDCRAREGGDKSTAPGDSRVASRAREEHRRSSLDTRPLPLGEMSRSPKAFHWNGNHHGQPSLGHWTLGSDSAFLGRTFEFSQTLILANMSFPSHQRLWEEQKVLLALGLWFQGPQRLLPKSRKQQWRHLRGSYRAHSQRPGWDSSLDRACSCSEESKTPERGAGV